MSISRPLKIFCDSPLGDDVIQFIRNGIAPHELVLPANPTSSVLSSSSDSLEGMDIVLGQPDAKKVLQSSTVRWVQVTSAGFTRYDTPEFRKAAQKRGLILTNSSHVYDEPCAEHVMAFMFAQGRKLPQTLLSQCNSGSDEWNDLRRQSRLLQGQSALLLGYGAIAERLLEMMTPLGMRVRAFRRKIRGNEKAAMVSLEELPSALSIADHVINILPDNGESRNFFNEIRFAQMKKGASFYNIGRGTTVDQTALARSLENRHLDSAWLDVTDPEPLPPDHPLRSLKNCHITPHTAGGHPDEFLRLGHHFLKNFHSFLKNEALDNRVI